MTIQEIISQVKEQRSGVIDTYTPLVVAAKADILAKLIDKRDSLEDFLLKTGTYIGVQTLIELYFDLCIALRTSGSQTTKMTKAIIETWTFDTNPVYQSTGALKSPTSTYITNNGLSLGGTSIFQALIDLIGVIQTNRAEPEYISNPEPPPDEILNPAYAPDYWDYSFDTLLGAIITNLNNLISNFLDPINNFYTNLSSNDYILNKDLFTGFDSGRLTFYSAIQTMITDLGNYRSTFNTLILNLTANRITIDSQLISILSYLSSSRTICENRITTISGTNTIFGNPTTANTVNNYREGILSMIVAYPDGIVQVIISTQAQGGSVTDIIVKQEKTLVFSGISSNEFIPKMEVISARFNKEKTQVRIQWIGHLHPNKYKIYRRLVADVSSNNEWSESDLIATINETNIDPQTGWTQQFYIDTTVSGANNYCYRIKAIDDYWSSHGGACVNSESEQSDVWSSGAIITKTTTL